ncbi:MAG: endonuclease III, partial [Bacteriovoracaceae bacterium]|nr:endonuclease III [Bacteriovoracaceae bacterium]
MKNLPRTKPQILASKIYTILKQAYPHAKCGLNFSNEYELLVATILSAQCTDQRVNLVLPQLFSCCPDLATLAQTKLTKIQELIRSVGLYQNKAKNLKALAQTLAAQNFVIPRQLKELIKLPGVGRKTANVVLSNAWGLAEGIAVDTHVQRITQILGLSKHQDPLKIEQDLMRLFPPAQWGEISHLIITLGRQVCQARRPACARCPLATLRLAGCRKKIGRGDRQGKTRP